MPKLLPCGLDEQCQVHPQARSGMWCRCSWDPVQLHGKNPARTNAAVWGQGPIQPCRNSLVRSQSDPAMWEWSIILFAQAGPAGANPAIWSLEIWWQGNGSSVMCRIWPIDWGLSTLILAVFRMMCFSSLLIEKRKQSY